MTKKASRLYIETLGDDYLPAVQQGFDWVAVRSFLKMGRQGLRQAEVNVSLTVEIATRSCRIWHTVPPILVAIAPGLRRIARCGAPEKWTRKWKHCDITATRSSL
jgi:hypothetical protein